MIRLICPSPGCAGKPTVTVPPDRSEIAVLCSACGVVHRLSSEIMADLARMEEFRAAVRKARPILSRVCVGVATGEREVKIPYNLLVGRLPAELAFDGSGGGRRFLFTAEEDNPENGGGEKI
jgi:hypothetical protein